MFYDIQRTVNPGGYYNTGQITCVVDGYRPIAICGFAAWTTQVAVVACYLDGSKILYEIKNLRLDAGSTFQFHVWVTFIKI